MSGGGAVSTASIVAESRSRTALGSFTCPYRRAPCQEMLPPQQHRAPWQEMLRCFAKFAKQRWFRNRKKTLLPCAEMTDSCYLPTLVTSLVQSSTTKIRLVVFNEMCLQLARS